MSAYENARRALDRALAQPGRQPHDINRAKAAVAGEPVPLARGEGWSVQTPCARIHEVALSPDGQIAIVGERPTSPGGLVNDHQPGVWTSHLLDPRLSAWKPHLAPDDTRDDCARVRDVANLQWSGGEVSYTYMTSARREDDCAAIVWGDCYHPLGDVRIHKMHYADPRNAHLLAAGRRGLPLLWNDSDGRPCMAVRLDHSDRTRSLDHAYHDSEGLVTHRYDTQFSRPWCMGVVAGMPVVDDYEPGKLYWKDQTGKDQAADLERGHEILPGTLHERDGQPAWLEYDRASGRLTIVREFGQDRDEYQTAFPDLRYGQVLRIDDQLLAVCTTEGTSQIMDNRGDFKTTPFQGFQVVGMGIVDEQTLVAVLYERGKGRHLLFIDRATGKFLNDPETWRVDGERCHLWHVGSRLVCSYRDYRDREQRDASPARDMIAVLSRPEHPDRWWEALGRAPGLARVEAPTLVEFDGQVYGAKYVGQGTISILPFG